MTFILRTRTHMSISRESMTLSAQPWLLNVETPCVELVEMIIIKRALAKRVEYP
jgi:hypothetical protein